jgi:hypothetical protein
VPVHDTYKPAGAEPRCFDEPASAGTARCAVLRQ